MTDEEKQKIVSDYMSNLSKKRWNKLTKEERSEYGKKIAKERWKNHKKENNEL